MDRPNPGLVDYVASKQIVATWEYNKDFLRDEASLAHLTEYNRSLDYMPESPVHLAVQEVFESTGENASCFKGILSSSSEGLNRIVAHTASELTLHCTADGRALALFRDKNNRRRDRVVSSACCVLRR